MTDDPFEPELRRRLYDAAQDTPTVDVRRLLAEGADPPVSLAARRRQRVRRLPALAAAAAVVAVVGAGGLGLVAGEEQGPGQASPTPSATTSPTDGAPAGQLPPETSCADRLRVGDRTYVASPRRPPPTATPVPGGPSGLLERCSTDPADPGPERSRVDIVPLGDAARTVLADGTVWVRVG